jgi:hypothetical protein
MKRNPVLTEELSQPADAVRVAIVQAEAEKAKAEAEKAKAEAEKAKAEADRVRAGANPASDFSTAQAEKAETAREAEERAKQDAEKRLKAEAEKAKQWRLKVDEAQAKGREYADRAEFKWSLSAVDNPMTDDKDYTVASEQPNGTGAVANIEWTCPNPGQVTFVATLRQASDPDSPLGLPEFADGYIAGNKRINDEPAFPTHFQMQKFRNRILVSTLASLPSAPPALPPISKPAARWRTRRPWPPTKVSGRPSSTIAREMRSRLTKSSGLRFEALSRRNCQFYAMETGHDGGVDGTTRAEVLPLFSPGIKRPSQPAVERPQ